MTSKTEVAGKADRTQQGFALILAILSLMLLTFLGLTLAATTSTELQIATNYRWSQQALYNAEAGIEVGKLILRNITDGDFVNLLPPSRAPRWKVTDTPTVSTAGPPPVRVATGLLPRDYENAGCDNRGGGTGYGVILSDTGISSNSQGDILYKTSFDFPGGQTVVLNGAVTLWVRRGIGGVDTTTGEIYDDTDSTVLVLTAEGIAPFSGDVLTQGGKIASFAQAQMAVRTREVVVFRANAPGGITGDPCSKYGGQTGSGQAGTGFAACARGSRGPGGCGAADIIRGALGSGARDEGGTLDHTGDAGGDTATLCDTGVE